MATASAAAIDSTSLSCDLRDWLKEVKRLEQLEQISGAHWDLEIGALTEIILERIATPPAVISVAPMSTAIPRASRSS